MPMGLNEFILKNGCSFHHFTYDIQPRIPGIFGCSMAVFYLRNGLVLIDFCRWLWVLNHNWNRHDPWPELTARVSLLSISVSRVNASPSNSMWEQTNVVGSLDLYPFCSDFRNQAFSILGTCPLFRTPNSELLWLGPTLFRVHISQITLVLPLNHFLNSELQNPPSGVNFIQNLHFRDLFCTPLESSISELRTPNSSKWGPPYSDFMIWKIL